jgi:hypothetical protein
MLHVTVSLAASEIERTEFSALLAVEAVEIVGAVASIVSVWVFDQSPISAPRSMRARKYQVSSAQENPSRS